MRPTLVCALALLGGLMAPFGALAKCGYSTYGIDVQVVERGSGKVLSGVVLVFFVPGSESAIPLEHAPGTRARTDDAGRFQGTLDFNSYSGWWFGDRCSARLSSLEVVAVPEDREAERIVFRGLRSVGASGGLDFKLEPLRMELFP